MRRFLLSFLCLAMAFCLYGEDKGHELITDSRHYLVEKNKKWFDFKSDISIYGESQVLEQTCCQLLGIDEQQTLQGYIEERFNDYKSKEPYSEEKRNQLARDGFVGLDYIFIGPKGDPVGNYQTFEIFRSYSRKGMKQVYLQEWNITYDLKNDKVLTVDNIFVPKIATTLKNNADGNFISICVQEKNISCGITPANGRTKFEPRYYLQNADDFTEQFKQAIAFDKLKAEVKRETEERWQQELERQRQEQDSLQKEKEEYLAKTAYKRITNEFGELVASKLTQINQVFSWTSETKNTSITAGTHDLKIIKNEDGTTDSLWIQGLITPQYAREQRLGVSERMSYSQTMTETTTRVMSNFSYESGRWTTYFDIDKPANNPLFEQRLCKLLMNKSCKQLEDAGKRFVKSFKGKWIGNKKANVVTISGRALSYNPEKYYSYAYGYTYLGFFTKTNFGKVGRSISKNIIYDIKNNKVLSLTDVLAIEEITNLGLKKKTKADLALDNNNLYVGIDGKPVCTYSLSRENWNKFTSVLQDLIGPYDNLPATIDSTAFVCQDYEGIQPASISYKVNQEPSYKGQTDSMMVYMKSKIVLPDSMKNEHSWKIQFVVEKDGHLSHVETKADKDGEVDKAFASKLTEAFEQMPAWQPLELAGLGKQNSLQTYNVKYVPYPTSGDNRIYYMVEENAHFPGGDEACLKWLSEHVKYPEICMELGVQGRVIVSFDVNKDGSISDIKTLCSPDPRLSKEAERVVRMMPKWVPAMQDGKPVRSRFMVPVLFRLGS